MWNVVDIGFWDVGYSGCEILRMWDVGDGAVGDVGCWGCVKFRMWDVWDVGCLGCGMFEMWDIWDVECSRCGTFWMWDIRDVGCGMWDVDLQNDRPAVPLKLMMVFLVHRYVCFYGLVYLFHKIQIVKSMQNKPKHWYFDIIAISISNII